MSIETFNQYSSAWRGQPFRWFHNLYGVAPCSMTFLDISDKKLAKVLKKAFPKEEIYEHWNVGRTKESKYLQELFLNLKDKKAIIYYEGDDYQASILYEAGADISELQKLLHKCHTPKEIKAELNYVNILCYNSNGFYLHSTLIRDTIVDITDNYNDDLKVKHELILEKLGTTNEKGIVLFYGPPGTGKSNYIRHLINRVQKKMIYVPPDLAKQIGSPTFIPFLMQHPNSILIIEDGENIIAKREGGGNQAVANLLNLSDGLLSDCLRMQIICTFNTDVNNVDSALRRKGRLIAEYEFCALEASKATKLSEKLGFNKVYSESTTLADIYNETVEKELAEQC